MIMLQNLGSYLHLCSKTKNFQHGTCLHAVVIKIGFQCDTFLSNNLLNMYAKCGKIYSAHQVFDEMTDRNLVSWSAMISGFDQANNPSMALDLFSQMPLKPNEFIYSSVVNSCTTLSALRQAKQVHAHSLKAGYASISFVSNSLISMYMNVRLWDDAFSIFSSMVEPNMVSFNATIAGFAESKQFERGLELFKLMHRKGFLPDLFTFAGLFEICTCLEDLQRGIVLHCLTVKLGLHITSFVGNLILTMYSKCCSLEEADTVFECIEDKDVVSWNTFIGACSHGGEHAKALRVFVEMREGHDVVPDDFTFTGTLAACASLASIRYGGQIHGHLIRNGMDADAGVNNALVNMYAKCGHIRNAESVFDRMLHHDLVSWNTIIAGLGNHGDGKRCIQLFERMKARGIMPDSITFIGLLAACNHAGLVDEGLDYFHSMTRNYEITPNIEHFSCLIDVLGRAGRLEDAEGYLKDSPAGDNLIILGSLLSACLLHGNVGVGERVGKRILELEPETSSPYVLLSNLYASDGRWEDVAESRRLLKGSLVKKVAAHSMIELKGVVEKFTVGDFSHSRVAEVRETLKSLSWAVRELSL